MYVYIIHNNLKYYYPKDNRLIWMWSSTKTGAKRFNRFTIITCMSYKGSSYYVEQ